MNQSKSLPTIILSLAAFAIQPNADAQGNLVDFSNWTLTGQGLYQGSGAPSISLYTSTGTQNASFTGVPSITGGFVLFALTGSLNTKPGATYDISFTMQNAGQSYLEDPSMSFGSFGASCNLLAGETLNGTDYSFVPEHYDFSIVATDPITTMSFNVTPDIGQGVFLSNVSVVQVQVQPVPESPSIRQFAFGACMLGLTQTWRRFRRQPVTR